MTEEKRITPKQLVNQIQMGLINLSDLIEQYEIKLREQAQEIENLKKEQGE